MKTADAIYYIDSRKPEAEELLSLRLPETGEGYSGNDHRTYQERA